MQYYSTKMSLFLMDKKIYKITPHSPILSSVGGLVVKLAVAIGQPRVRFPVDAKTFITIFTHIKRDDAIILIISNHFASRIVFLFLFLQFSLHIICMIDT